VLRAFCGRRDFSRGEYSEWRRLLCGLLWRFNSLPAVRTTLEDTTSLRGVGCACAYARYALLFSLPWTLRFFCLLALLPRVRTSVPQPPPSSCSMRFSRACSVLLPFPATGACEDRG